MTVTAGSDAPCTLMTRDPEASRTDDVSFTLTYRTWPPSFPVDTEEDDTRKSRCELRRSSSVYELATCHIHTHVYVLPMCSFLMRIISHETGNMVKVAENGNTHTHTHTHIHVYIARMQNMRSSLVWGIGTKVQKNMHVLSIWL